MSGTYVLASCPMGIGLFPYVRASTTYFRGFATYVRAFRTYVRGSGTYVRGLFPSTRVDEPLANTRITATIINEFEDGTPSGRRPPALAPPRLAMLHSLAGVGKIVTTAKLSQIPPSRSK